MSGHKPRSAQDETGHSTGRHDHPDPPQVEVFWRPGCPYCGALRTVLLDRGVDATWRNIWTDKEARALVREANHGNETVPTVRVGATTLTTPSWHQLAPVLERTDREPRGRAAAVPHRPWALAVLRWPWIVLVVLASEILARTGDVGIGYAFDGLALASWWLTRPAR